MSQRPAPNRNLINYALDLLIFVAFLVAMAPRFSGIAVHEWLSIAFTAAIVTHLLLHWSWIMQITRRLFGKVAWTARLNYLVNTALFIAMTVVIFTGLVISEAALPLVGIGTVRGGVWERMHHASADLTLWLLGLHVALHWRWVVNTTTRVLPRWRTAERAAAARRDPRAAQQEA